MSNPFFEKPILNSPYECPARHWELDSSGQPTQRVLSSRRSADFITPIPRPRKRKGGAGDQADLIFDEGKGLSTADQQYSASRELVPTDMLGEVERAKIVITNYHAFKLRERMGLSKGGRRRLQGRDGEALNTLETEGQMLQRVMPELMGMKNILAINDEAHHCYREKPASSDEDGLKGDDKRAAQENNETARLWISGLEAVNRKLGLSRVFDLSATRFFLSGSGYAEGTLFPRTMSDFSLMDAIECGIVKLPRVPVADNIPGTEMPKFRELWKHIGPKMPRKGRGKARQLDPFSIPVELQTALEVNRPDFPGGSFT